MAARPLPPHPCCHSNDSRYRDSRNRTLLLNPIFDDDFLDVDVIPDVVALLRSCKLLSQRLVATMLQELSVARDNNAQRIVEVSKLIGPRLERQLPIRATMRRHLRACLSVCLG